MPKWYDETLRLYSDPRPNPSLVRRVFHPLRFVLYLLGIRPR